MTFTDPLCYGVFSLCGLRLSVLVAQRETWTWWDGDPDPLFPDAPHVERAR